MEKRTFEMASQLSKTKIFEVCYHVVGSNDAPYFATSAMEFCRNKRDYRRCGQAQDDITKGFATARNFWKKWDKCHIKDLTDEQYTEMIADLKVLMEEYNFVQPATFGRIVAMSKLTPKSEFNSPEKWQTYMQEELIKGGTYSSLNDVNKC